MAKTQGNTPSNEPTGSTAPPAPQPNGAFPYSDGDIIVGVSAKDATRGHYAVVPAPKLPADLDPGLATAANVGFYYDAVRALQSEANKAVKAGKSGDALRDAINEAAKKFAPATDRSLNTVAAKRVEIAEKMVSDALESRGVATTEANVKANLAGFMARRKAEIDAGVLASIAAGYAVTKKNTGGTAAAGSGSVIEDL